jgi:hypothetical protein
VLLLVALASLPSLHLRCHQHHAGIFDLMVMVPVPLLRWCCPPFVALASAQSRRRSRRMVVHCVCVVVVLVVSCAPSSPCGVVVIIYVNRPGYAKRLAGSKALLALAMHGRHVRPHHHTQRHHLFVWALPEIELVVALAVLAYLPLLHWRHCQHCAGISPSMCWHHCPSFAGFCPLAMLLTTRCHCRAGIFASAALASLPALRWHLCQHCAGLVALVVQVSLPALGWRLHPPCTGTVAFVALASSP